MKKQFYKISNTFYSQDELSYKDNEQVNNLLKAADIKLSLLNEQTIGTILDMLYEGGTLKKNIFNHFETRNKRIERFV